MLAANYRSGDDFVVEFLGHRFEFSVDDFEERVTAAAFGQRRKMLRQSLKGLGLDPLPLLATCGIAETARAEEIPVEGFVALANALAEAEKSDA